jgi:hypothetical protein
MSARWKTTYGQLLVACLFCPWLPLFAQTPTVAGVVWQPHNDNLRPQGNWHQLGAAALLVQWSTVDGKAFLPSPQHHSGNTPPLPAVNDPGLPDWERIGAEPWAQEVIMGLPGYFQETTARAQAAQLARTARDQVHAPSGVHVVGWYFPVEFDPTWDVPTELIDALANLPRPLWFSVYDSANVGPVALIRHIERWLPGDAGLFFQDGVGVHARDAHTAQHYAQALKAHFGENRVRLIAEAFRPSREGGFRAATPAELGAQLTVYSGQVVYLFEGPTYVTPATVSALLATETPPSTD